jgi:hypothetical protein
MRRTNSRVDLSKRSTSPGGQPQTREYYSTFILEERLTGDNSSQPSSPGTSPPYQRMFATPAYISQINGQHISPINMPAQAATGPATPDRRSTARSGQGAPITPDQRFISRSAPIAPHVRRRGSRLWSRSPTRAGDRVRSNANAPHRESDSELSPATSPNPSLAELRALRNRYLNSRTAIQTLTPPRTDERRAPRP